MIDKLKLLLRDAYNWDYTGEQTQDEENDNEDDDNKENDFWIINYLHDIQFFLKIEFDFSKNREEMHQFNSGYEIWGFL